ncbi:MAG: hypothetical protein GY789_11885 [Hyphomicrobiales bacterium]|nr:hypothetical protein [Hyphomicrobiales bacterium]MCP5001005.1 hypothetical protein [Hyphomicrobiales bacterium]
MFAVNTIGRKTLNRSEKERLKKRLRLLQRSLEAFPAASISSNQSAGEWIGVDEWAQSAMRTTYDIIFQLGSDRRRTPEVGTALNRAMSAYDATADIVDRKYTGLRGEDFHLAKRAIRRCIESGTHLL